MTISLAAGKFQFSSYKSIFKIIEVKNAKFMKNFTDIHNRTRPARGASAFLFKSDSKSRRSYKGVKAMQNHGAWQNKVIKKQDMVSYFGFSLLLKGREMDRVIRCLNETQSVPIANCRRVQSSEWTVHYRIEGLAHDGGFAQLRQVITKK